MYLANESYRMKNTYTIKTAYVIDMLKTACNTETNETMHMLS